MSNTSRSTATGTFTRTTTRIRRPAVGLLLALSLLLGGLAQAKARGAGRGGQAKAQAAAPAARAGVVNINTGTEDQLRLLPGIGPSKARAVVAYRTRVKFRATHELIRVKGIGRKTFRTLRPYLTVEGPTTLSTRPRPEAPQGEGKPQK